jgi:hypothetical protein
VTACKVELGASVTVTAEQRKTAADKLRPTSQSGGSPFFAR